MLMIAVSATSFNGHPPLGVNATGDGEANPVQMRLQSFNGHPPLGVNATDIKVQLDDNYLISFNGHPPLGVNAT